MKALILALLLLMPTQALADRNTVLLDVWIRMGDAQKHVKVRDVASVVYLVTDDRTTEATCQLLMTNFQMREEFFTVVRGGLSIYEANDVGTETLSAAIASFILIVANESRGSGT